MQIITNYYIIYNVNISKQSIIKGEYMMATSIDNILDKNLVITFYMLNSIFKNNGDKRNLTQLEMHKLLYIAYSHYYFKNQTPLFKAEFEA